MALGGCEQSPRRQGLSGRETDALVMHFLLGPCMRNLHLGLRILLDVSRCVSFLQVKGFPKLEEDDQAPAGIVLTEIMSVSMTRKVLFWKGDREMLHVAAKGILL